MGDGDSAEKRGPIHVAEKFVMVNGFFSEKGQVKFRGRNVTLKGAAASTGGQTGVENSKGGES